MTDNQFLSLAQEVYSYAEANYNEGGWDVIVECMTLDEIADRLKDADLEELTPAAAIDSFRPSVSVWSEREADARNSAF